MRDRVRPALNHRPVAGAGILNPGLRGIGRSAVLAAWLAVLPMAAGPALAATAAPAKPTPAKPTPAQPGPAPMLSPDQGAQIVAVVNGDVISMADVVNRRRLFAISTGLPLTKEVLDRLTHQVIRQLIDEKLQLQEIERRGIAVSDKQIAAAINEIEARNGMAPGTLVKRLKAAGVNIRTMYDQTRVQLGWGMVLRQVLGAQAQVTDADVAELERTLKAEKGQTEFNIAEIFVPIANPNQAADARRFADTVIQQLRAGAPFAVVAAQFSQSQTALRGGERGWVQSNQVSREELRILKEMPVGAISNPISVPGGLSIVTLRGRRVIGDENVLMASVRQVFFPFTTKLNQNQPTDQQTTMLDKARVLSQTTGSCDALNAAAAKVPGAKVVDPGEIAVNSVAAPVLRQLVATLPVGHASQPLIADDGVAVVMVCARGMKSLGLPPRQQLVSRILNQRVELASRQLLRDLQRSATIDLRY